VAFDGVAGGLIDVEAVAVEAINHQPLDGGETCEEGQPRTGARVAPFDLDERLAGIARLRGPVNGYWSVNRRQAGQHRDSLHPGPYAEVNHIAEPARGIQV